MSPINDAIATADDSVDALIELHTTSVDTLRGFEKIGEKADVSFRPLALQFTALHQRQVARLDTIVREMGGLPDANGSFMGTLNRAVVAVRATLVGIDENSMAAIRSGENHLLGLFDRALMCSLPQGHVLALTQMRAEISDLLNSTDHVNRSA